MNHAHAFYVMNAFDSWWSVVHPFVTNMQQTPSTPKFGFVLFTLLAGMTACAGARPAPVEAPLANGTGSLTVIIDEVRGTSGHIRCSLFNAPEGFPGPSSIRGGNVVVAPQSGARCAFSALPKGTYAVTVYHDANDSGEIDTNIFGAPTEGYGATQNHLPAASAAKFSESSVAIADGQAITSHVQLRY